MKIDIQGFKASVSSVSADLIQDEFASQSSNCIIEDGNISPLKSLASKGFTAGINDVSLSVVRARNGASKIVTSANTTHWVESPLAEDQFDRVYWTRENGAPQVAGYATMSTAYDLGIAKPVAAPNLSVSGGGDEANLVRAIFVEESQWGELSAPSSPSGAVMMVQGGTLTITLPNAPASGHWTHRLIFITDELGSFRFAGRIVNTQSTLSLSDLSNLGETLNQIDEGVLNTPPRASLRGLVQLPGGVLAGFDKNVVAFSRAYLPHAWPVDYEITIDGHIQAMAVAASGLVVLTDKKPYLIVGSDPAAMSAVQLDLTESCLSPKAVVDMGDYVIYPSANGLIAIAGQDNRNLSDSVIGRKAWDGIKSSSAVACNFDGKYWYFGDQGGFIFDPATNSYTDHDFTAKAVYADNLNGELLIHDGTTSLKVYARENLGGVASLWQSKRFYVGQRSSLSSVKINATAPVDFTLRYIDNETNVFSFEMSGVNAINPGQSVRLPVQRAEKIQFVLRSTGDIKRIQLASSMVELN
jgi:hypothetical protein